MAPEWNITNEKIKNAIQRIVSFKHPLKIILFGSAAREQTHKHSDVDMLVVTKEDIDNPRRESVLLRRCVKGILMPMDILVISQRKLKELANQPGLIYKEALSSGKVVYEAS